MSGNTDPRRTSLWFADWLGPWQTRKWRTKRPSRDSFCISRGNSHLHAIARETTGDLHTGRGSQLRVMAPLSLPLSSVLRHACCLQSGNVFCNVLHGLHRRPFRSRLWKRNFGAVTHGVGQLLSHQSRVQNYAASVRSSSSGGQDMTDWLWSVYKETKRQTEGTDTVTRACKQHCGNCLITLLWLMQQIFHQPF